MINETLLVTGVGLAAYPIGSIVKLIVTDENEGLIHIDKTPKKISDMMDEMVNDISIALGVDVELMISSTREQQVTIPRQILIYFLILRFNIPLNVSLNKIGTLINRHHATVIYSKKSVENALEVNDPLVLLLFNRAFDCLSNEDKYYIELYNEKAKQRGISQRAKA